LLIGFASTAAFTYEVLWTRLLGQVLGGSLFAFATMLAGFLTGIAVGSCLAVRLIRRGHPALRLLLFSQAAAAVATVVMFAGIDVVPYVSQWIGSGLTGGFVANVTLCLAVLLPSTIAIGMSLPLAIEVAGRGHSNLSQVTGRLFAASTLGAIAGSLLCGHVLLPWLGFHGTVAVAAAINLGVASCVLFWERPERRYVRIAVSIPAVVAALVFVGGPDAILRYRPLHNIVAPRTVVYSQVGASANVMLSHEEFGYRLLCNGLPEALIAPRGAVGGASNGARWLAALPVLARPDAKSMLIIGLGGGSLIEGVPETIESIDTVELEPKVVAAIRTISNERAHDPLSDPLSDPRLRLVINDARGALSLSSKSYDAIVSQPSHPWTTGASHLYTREFMQLAHSHLTQNGVLLQWMNSKYATEGQVQSLGATLRDVFLHVRVYQPTEGLLLFLASDSSLQIEEQIMQTGRPLRSGMKSFRWIGVNDVHDVAAALLMDEPALRDFCAGAPIITDNDNHLATGSFRRSGDSLAVMNPEVFRRSDALIHRSDAQPLTDRIGLDAAKLVRVLLLSKQEARARMIAESLSGERDRLLAEGYVSLYTGDPNTAMARFRAVLEANPNDRDARFKLTEIVLPQIATGQVSQTIQLASHAVSLKSPIVAAATAYYSQDWQQLQFLDGQLGIAAPGDIWLALSLTFRAAWRTKVVDENRRQRYGEEALELIDRAIVIEPTVFASIVRLQAAEQTGRVEPWLESAVYLAHLFEKQSHTVTPKMARAVSRQVLARVATITPTTPWQKDRCDTIRKLYEQIQTAGQK
jgi:spermidine synthase